MKPISSSWFSSGCCKLYDKLSQAHEAILLLMKWSIQAPEFGQSSGEYAKDVLGHIPFALPTKVLTGNDGSMSTFNPRIFLAAFDQRSNQELQPALYNRFFRTLTTEGIGYTYNGEAFTKIYQSDNPFGELFSKVMDPQPEVIKGNPHMIYHAYQSGPETTRKFIIQLNEYNDYYDKITTGLFGPYIPHR